jgi:aspartate oxidase
LVNETGERFMLGTPNLELARRDIVARAIWRQLVLGIEAFSTRVRPLAMISRVGFPALRRAQARGTRRHYSNVEPFDGFDHLDTAHCRL